MRFTYHLLLKIVMFLHECRAGRGYHGSRRHACAKVRNATALSSKVHTAPYTSLRAGVLTLPCLCHGIPSPPCTHAKEDCPTAVLKGNLFISHGFSGIRMLTMLLIHCHRFFISITIFPVCSFQCIIAVSHHSFDRKHPHR